METQHEIDHLLLGALVYGGLLTFIGGVILLIAFASPYWLASYEDTRTETAFNNMGLWEYCFEDYRHPNYQFDKLFTGCHYVYSKEYHIIREWLLPGICNLAKSDSFAKLNWIF